MSLKRYGHISPKTFLGQSFCIVYALFGIGVLMAFLAKVGNAMAVFFKYTYRYFNLMLM